MLKVVLSVAVLITSVNAAGFTQPHSSFSISECEEGLMVVDNANMCWFHRCVHGAGDESGNHNLKLVPFRCALGSKVSYNYISGMSNPCTINFNSELGYDCERREQSITGPPPCYATYLDNQQCTNGGTAVFLANMCWCMCPPSWQGDADCSKPTVTADVRAALGNFSPICVDGAPLDDYCGNVGGCLNGGSCFNQCNSFWCDCPNHEDYDYYGKRCELPPRN